MRMALSPVGEYVPTLLIQGLQKQAGEQIQDVGQNRSAVYNRWFKRLQRQKMRGK